MNVRKSHEYRVLVEDCVDAMVEHVATYGIVEGVMIDIHKICREHLDLWTPQPFEEIVSMNAKNIMEFWPHAESEIHWDVAYEFVLFHLMTDCWARYMEEFGWQLDGYYA